MSARLLRTTVIVLGFAVLVGFMTSSADATPQDDLVPHGQDAPPNDPLSPEEAVKRMTVPEGFTVELVASEPDLVNPVAMTFDERGRIWITESLEYPRREPGPGRDRIKVLEDTTGDGRADKIEIFADGLNIPSGIAVGHGGVWVANSPDILFYPNADGDLEPDGPPEVVVTGFGRADTHELPNSLTWGPDGWLYGWNGVFNPSVVEHNGKTYKFTCAIFRIHPVTRDFELFCEGTSNPWGIAFDPEGSLFASACVIDHLWHLVESGYYHRQGGPYPPFTWKIESIVDHTHQKRAYCGIHYYDSDAYPPNYRDKLYMGNIHGNCVNVDSLTRDGSTYRGHAEPDFLSANDAWFMTVSQKTGPDGSLYVLDWYDRYHCYQDANRDPKGIDRLKGRLYRVRYGETPRVVNFDMSMWSNERLIEALGAPNGYRRDIARRLLTERLIENEEPACRAALEAVALDVAIERRARMNALWGLVGSGRLETGFHRALLEHKDPGYRAWGVRAAGNMGKVDASIRTRVAALAADPAPAVALQAAIASTKIEGLEPLPLLVEAASTHGEDGLIARIVWGRLHPRLETEAEAFVQALEPRSNDLGPAFRELLPRAIDRILRAQTPDAASAARLLARLFATAPEDEAWNRARRDAVGRLLAARRENVLTSSIAQTLKDEIEPQALRRLKGSGPETLRFDAAQALALLGNERGRLMLTEAATDPRLDTSRRLSALETLIELKAPESLSLAERLLDQAGLEAPVFEALGALDDPKVAALPLDRYDDLEPDIKPRAINLLIQRPAWARSLLERIGDGSIPTNALNVSQVRGLLASPDAELVDLVRRTWGTVRAGRDPEREQDVERIRQRLRQQRGDPFAGRVAYERVCAQCHVIYGKGEEVGPDLTGNGRGSFDQLVSNVLDPNLVIGAAYQATLVATADGRILNGLLVEDNERRIVLKLQGGERAVVPRDEIEAMRIAETSLMPESIEEQLSEQEIIDLFAFLSLDQEPEDPEARPIEGTPPSLIGARADADGEAGTRGAARQARDAEDRRGR